jgi:hypothetical protein
VVTVNVPDVAPLAIVSVPGTWAEAMLELKFKVIAEGACPDSVTVAVEDAPPRRLDGDSETPVGTGGTIESRTGVAVTPNALAPICAMILLETGAAVIANVPVVDPEGTDPVPETVTPAVSEDVAKVNPAGGAAALIVTVPVIGAPP